MVGALRRILVEEVFFLKSILFRIEIPRGDLEYAIVKPVCSGVVAHRHANNKGFVFKGCAAIEEDVQVIMATQIHGST